MTTPLELINLFILGIAGGLFSGLLGIGGGIIMLPLLITVPPFIGVTIGLRPAIGITMLQSLTGSLSGIVVHRKHNAMDHSLALILGGSTAVGSLGGAVLSRMVSERLMAILFAFMAVTSLLLMLLPEQSNQESDGIPRHTRLSTATLVGGGVGFLAGIIGQGGAFIILPLLINVFLVPIRTAIGTTAAVAFLSALAGFIGKWGTGQVPLHWGVAVSLGALLGGQIGGMLSHRLSTSTLRRILFLVVAASAVRLLTQVL